MGGRLPETRKLVHAGSFAALETALWRELACVRATTPLAPLVVLVPTNLLRRHLTATAATRGGCINVHFLTLLDLARKTGEPALAAGGRTPMPKLAGELVARSVCRRTPVGYFASLADCPGFHRALLATIADFKEAGLTPDGLSKAIDGLPSRHTWLAPKLRELQTLWAACEARVADRKLYEPSDLLAAAADAAATDTWLASVAGLFVYGFYDLNALQRRLVSACVVGRPAWALFPFQPDAEAFAYARPTFEWFVGQGFEAVAEHEPKPPLPAELAALQGNLFEPLANEPRDAGDRLRILSAPDEVREVHAIVRSAVAAAREGTTLPRVGILLRQADLYGGLFAEECAAGGLEAYLHSPPPLSASRAGRSLLMLLRLLGSNLLRSDVMDFVTYADIAFDELLGADAEPATADWDKMSIDAGVVKGADEWRRRLATLRRRLEARHGQGVDDDGDDEALARTRKRLASLDAFEHVLEALFAALDGVVRQGSWADVTGSVLEAFKRLVRESDERRAVGEAVAELMRFDVTGEQADVPTVARLAGEVLEAAHGPRAVFGTRGPVVVDLMEGRGLPFDVVHVPGVVEKGFPAPARIDPLLSDRERGCLADVGLALPLKSQRASEERLLFRLAVGAGAERVVLSYPRLDPGSGRDRVPSHFLVRSVEAATGRRCTVDELAKFDGYRRLGGPGFAPGEPADAWREAEYDLAVVQGAVARDEGGELAYLAEVSATFDRALHAEARRWGERRFTEFDGVLASAPALDALAGMLSPGPWHVSATALEQYAACPFRFFLARVLRVEPVEEPEAVQRMSGLDRGRLIHTILYRVLTRARAEGWLPLRREHEERVLDVAREGFAEFEREGVTGFPALWALERESVELELRRFVLDEAAEAEGYVPAHFEVCFGQRPREGEGELGSTEGVVFDLGEGSGQMVLRGKIDRIDVRADGGAARVLDYKTGSLQGAPKGNSFAGGTALQLPLYLRAAQKLLGDCATVEQAAYWYLTERGGHRRIAFDREALEGREGDLIDILRTIASCIGKGQFFAGLAGAPCRNCDYQGVCGAAACATARLKADDPAAEPYQKMREIE